MTQLGDTAAPIAIDQSRARDATAGNDELLALKVAGVVLRVFAEPTRR